MVATAALSPKSAQGSPILHFPLFIFNFPSHLPGQGPSPFPTMKNTLILSDNCELLTYAIKSCRRQGLDCVEFACSPRTTAQCESLVNAKIVPRLDVEGEKQKLLNTVRTLISLHCRQIFPPGVVKAIRCINFHPGFNPHNRGWFPHVFSMINGQPAGITIHEMDEAVDHGPIIHREAIAIAPDEVSADVYRHIIEREKILFDHWIGKLIRREYETHPPEQEGNYQTKQDFERLKEMHLEEESTVGEVLSYLRAMTFPGYKNAYFRDQASGRRCYVTIHIETDERAE